MKNTNIEDICGLNPSQAISGRTLFLPLPGDWPWIVATGRLKILHSYPICKLNLFNFNFKHLAIDSLSITASKMGQKIINLNIG